MAKLFATALLTSAASFIAGALLTGLLLAGLFAGEALAGPTFTMLADDTSFVHDYTYTDSGTGQLVTRDVFRVDVILTGLTGDLAGQAIGNLGFGIAIIGTGASHLSPLPQAMQKSGADWAGDFAASGLTWRFTDGPATQSQNIGGLGGKTMFVWSAANAGQAKVLAPGDAVARFYFAWDGLGQGQNLHITIYGDGADDQPHLRLYSGTPAGPQYGPVTNDGLDVTLVPEPATLALLGLGLAAMTAARVHRKR